MTIEDRLKQIIGQLVFENAVLRQQMEEMQTKVAPTNGDGVAVQQETPKETA
jgi:hypothetical protein